MAAPPSLSQLRALAGRMADTEARRRGVRPKPPPLLVLTDPIRVSDPLALAERLPQNTALVYRAFGSPDALPIARRLAVALRRKGCVLLIGADDALAQACGADGVHLPERMTSQAPRLRARRPSWILTGAAHGARALRRAELAGLDAALLSTVFPSSSPSAGTPLGPVRFSALASGATIPVYALGGVDATRAKRLFRAAGLAAVGAALPRPSS